MDPRIAAGIETDTASLIALGSRAKQIGLNFRAGARSILSGAHISRFRGRGMDFSESREYSPGDDVRHIDWRVTARTGKPHTKLYTEERERPVFIVADFPDSMYFGTRGSFKSVTAARASAYIAWSVLAGGDRVGGVLATRQTITDIRPTAGRRGILRLLDSVANATQQVTKTASNPDSSTRQGSLLDNALQHLCGVVHPGSLVILISDLYGFGPDSSRLLAQLVSHNDMVVCHVVDPLEYQSPGLGSFLVSDGNHKSRLDLSTRRRSARYQRLASERQQKINDRMTGLSIPLLQLVGGEDIEDALCCSFARFGNRRTR